jgi:major membrane immunogen (membrane-anchored lipoprotein)
MKKVLLTAIAISAILLVGCQENEYRTIKTEEKEIAGTITYYDEYEDVEYETEKDPITGMEVEVEDVDKIVELEIQFKYKGETYTEDFTFEHDDDEEYEVASEMKKGDTVSVNITDELIEKKSRDNKDEPWKVSTYSKVDYEIRPDVFGVEASEF